MENRYQFVIVAFLVIFFAAGIAGAGSRDVAVAAKAGTLGIGAEATVGINETFNGRIGFNVFSIDHDDTYNDVDYEFDVDLFSLPVLLDWHPNGGGFRVSVGAMVNGNEASGEGQAANGVFTIGNTVYSAAQVGTLKADVDFNGFAPYLGVGYGNAVGKGNKWSFFFDVGVAYQGSADVTLTANGPIAGDATFQSELEKERQDLEDDMDDFQFYPVIAIGVSYKF